MQLQESLYRFFIGIACRRFFLFFHLVRNISESESASFFCYFFRARPQQRVTAHVVPCLLPRRKRDNRAKIDGGWSKGGEGNSESTMGWNYAYERWWTKVFDPIRNLISKRWVSKGFADFILTRKYGVLSVMDRVIFLSRHLSSPTNNFIVPPIIILYAAGLLIRKFRLWKIPIRFLD